ncbi:MAG: hypothetical protein HN556_02890 [Gammaproteobacteria bacterium]|nr:hypothetical protein [Gammaproteobacteria bacterium]
MQNVVCIINGMLRKMKTDEQNTPLNEMLICSIGLTTDNDFSEKGVNPSYTQRRNFWQTLEFPSLVAPKATAK